LHGLAKVRVASSNLVIRSREVPAQRPLRGAEQRFLVGVLAHHLPINSGCLLPIEHLRSHDAFFHAFVMLAAMTGARRAQLLALRWRDVNFTIGQIAFSNGWVEGPTGPVLTASKSKRRHTVELDQPS
jgi:integrase